MSSNSLLGIKATSHQPSKCGLTKDSHFQVSQLKTGMCVLTHVQLFCDPFNSILPGSSVHGILQARILDWVAISSSRGSSRPGDGTRVSCVGRQVL